MAVRATLKRGAYHDSVTLMRIGVEVKKHPGVSNAVVGMGTDFNLDSLKRLNLFSKVLEGAAPADLMICVEAETDAAADAGVALAETLLTQKARAKPGAAEAAPRSLAGALQSLPEANVVLVSVPGAFAADEARAALDAGRHVMLFSDNVAVEEEIALKDLAVSKGLLMMGPDCGTAILNGTPLAFANAVRRGPIGVVAAAGTGLQEATSLVHRFGSGITQAIGLGGRDLSEKVGGRMALLSVEALAADPETKVLLLVSKPPHPATLERLFGALRKIDKPVVCYFIGADPKSIEAAGFTPAANLEEAARRAIEKATGRAPAPLVPDAEVARRAAAVRMSGIHLRGLYSGGTLCDEAQRFLLPVLGALESNTPVQGAAKMKDIHKSSGHTIVDLGDDDFTRGRAHPMIDPTTRQERLAAEIFDASVGLVLLDVVLGYGSHPDMAGALAGTIEAAAKKAGRRPVIAASICGTDEDPQGFDSQARRLAAAGVEVFPSHASMARFAAAVMGAAR